MSINLSVILSAVLHVYEVLDVSFLILVPPRSYPRFFQDLWRDDSPRLGTILRYRLSHVLDVLCLRICDLRVFLHIASSGWNPLNVLSGYIGVLMISPIWLK